MGQAYPTYIVPFEILNDVGLVSYGLALPLSLLRVHFVFHVSMLNKYHGNDDYIIHWDLVLLDKNIFFEEKPVEIIDLDI